MHFDTMSPREAVRCPLEEEPGGALLARAVTFPQALARHSDASILDAPALVIGRNPAMEVETTAFPILKLDHDAVREN